MSNVSFLLRWPLQGLLLVSLCFAPATYAAQEAKLVGCARFDFETGADDRHPPNVNFDVWYDLIFCGGNENEYLRALPGVSWVDSPMRNFALGPSHMAQASYTIRKHSVSGYPDLFFNAAFASNVLVGQVYWIRTREGSLVKLRVKNFIPFQKHRGIVRDMLIEYVVYLKNSW